MIQFICVFCFGGTLRICVGFSLHAFLYCRCFCLHLLSYPYFAESRLITIRCAMVKANLVATLCVVQHVFWSVLAQSRDHWLMAWKPTSCSRGWSFADDSQEWIERIGHETVNETVNENLNNAVMNDTNSDVNSGVSAEGPDFVWTVLCQTTSQRNRSGKLTRIEVIETAKIRNVSAA